MTVCSMCLLLCAVDDLVLLAFPILDISDLPPTQFSRFHATHIKMSDSATQVKAMDSVRKAISSVFSKDAFPYTRFYVGWETDKVILSTFVFRQSVLAAFIQMFSVLEGTASSSFLYFLTELEVSSGMVACVCKPRFGLFHCRDHPVLLSELFSPFILDVSYYFVRSGLNCFL